MPRDIDRYETKEMVEQGAQLVEVLPWPQYEESHLPGAINIPLKEMDEASVSRLDRDRPVIVYCSSDQ